MYLSIAFAAQRRQYSLVRASQTPTDYSLHKFGRRMVARLGLKRAPRPKSERQSLVVLSKIIVDLAG
jgi:hypothetical protein